MQNNGRESSTFAPTKKADNSTKEIISNERRCCGATTYSTPTQGKKKVYNGDPL
jgi:hypothetical protein